MKNLTSMIVEFRLINVEISGIGRMRVISTSKIRKITAIRKNRKENGIRADLFGSNPHSKADGFSRSGVFFFAIIEFTRIRIRGRANEIRKIFKIMKVII
jgi:hypothetical protein